jgi:hypothetical protein
VLRARIDGHWRAVKAISIRAHAGANRYRLAGRWGGQLLPARQDQIQVGLGDHGHWHTKKTLTITVTHTAHA